MQVTYDPDSDQAYVYLAEHERGAVVDSVLIDDPDLPGDLVIDLDASGRVVGIEIPFEASAVLPRAVLDAAEGSPRSGR